MLQGQAVETLVAAFRAALAAAAPEQLLPNYLRSIDDGGAAVVLGAGKAAAAMASAFHAHWQGASRGLVVTRYGHGLRDKETAGRIEVIEAGHPSPDAASLDAGARLLQLAATMRVDERLFFLISGGGSALAAAPLDAVSFDAKRSAADYLIRAGADIREINCVRKHLSGLKGGRLAVAAHPSPVVTLAISDVPGDDVGAIASGPTIPDATTQSDALRLLEKYRYPGLESLRKVLQNPEFETPKPGQTEFEGDRVHLIASASTALQAAERFLSGAGYQVMMLGDDLDDEARQLGREHARLAQAQCQNAEPVAILSGGETRVVLSGNCGKGGRNLEYLSGLALELEGAKGIYALAADTDGIDGNGDHAGGIVTPDLLARGARIGSSLAEAADAHDSYSYFDACDALLRTGPTRTNVNDFRVILCQPTLETTRQ